MLAVNFHIKGGIIYRIASNFQLAALLGVISDWLVIRVGQCDDRAGRLMIFRAATHIDPLSGESKSFDSCRGIRRADYFSRERLCYLTTSGISETSRTIHIL